MRFLAVQNSFPNRHDPSRKGLSGGDSILWEILKDFLDRGRFESVELLGCGAALATLRARFTGRRLPITREVRTPNFLYSFLPILFLYKTIAAFYALGKARPWDGRTILFSSSDIFPDSFPCLFWKMLRRDVKWVPAFYLFAPSPFSKTWPYRGKENLRGLIYWASQRMLLPFLRRHADRILVCNEIDRLAFEKKGVPREKIWPIYGGVDLAECSAVEAPTRRIDAVFMARFHPQKGPVVAVRAWAEVVKRRPGALLAMIGGGEEEARVRQAIRELGLEANVELHGFLAGAEKWRLLKSARLFVHPPVYDTGGMAAAEGMAAGLPVIAFDLEGYRYCYPRGMARVAPVGDPKALADGILAHLESPGRLEALAKEASDFSRTWSWEAKASAFFEFLDARTPGETS